VGSVGDVFACGSVTTPILSASTCACVATCLNVGNPTASSTRALKVGVCGMYLEGNLQMEYDKSWFIGAGALSDTGTRMKLFTFSCAAYFDYYNCLIFRSGPVSSINRASLSSGGTFTANEAVVSPNIIACKDNPTMTFCDTAGSTYDAAWYYCNDKTYYTWGGGSKTSFSADGGMVVGQDCVVAGCGAPACGLLVQGVASIGTCVQAPTIVATAALTVYNGANLELVAPAASVDMGDIVFHTGATTTASEFARLYVPSTGCLYYRSACDGLIGRCVYHTGNLNMSLYAPLASPAFTGDITQTDSSLTTFTIDGNTGASGISLAAALQLRSNTNIRARGVLMQTTDAAAEWYAGVPYNGGAAYQIGYDPSASNAEYTTYSKLTIDSSGNGTFAGTATADAFKQCTNSTDFTHIVATRAGDTLYVNQGNATGDIASFWYNSTTAGAGTEALRISNTGINITGIACATTCVRAPVVCATTCFAGSGAGLTLVPRDCGRVATDYNAMITSGMWGAADANANNPDGKTYLAVINSHNSDVGLQIAGGYTSDNLYFRGWYTSAAAWTTWRCVYHSGNLSPVQWAGSTANGIATYVSASCACSEPNLTFDGSTLEISTPTVGNSGGILTLSNTSNVTAGQTAGEVHFYKADASTQGAGVVGTIKSTAIDSGGTYDMVFMTGQDVETPAGSNGTMTLSYQGHLTPSGNLTFGNDSAKVICVAPTTTTNACGCNLLIVAGHKTTPSTVTGNYQGGIAYLIGGCGSPQTSTSYAIAGRGGEVILCGGLGGAHSVSQRCGGDGGSVWICGGTYGAGGGGTYGVSGDYGTVYLRGACVDLCSRYTSMCSTIASQIRVGTELGYCQNASTVYLFYNGAARIQTTSAGMTLTGVGSATDWVATSDRRLKKNITPITSALSKIDCLCGVCYELCEDGTLDMGLIAQDVEKVEPRLVSHTEISENDKSKFGIEDEKLGLKYNKMAGLFVEAIKELKEQNNCLQLQINELRKDLK